MGFHTRSVSGFTFAAAPSREMENLHKKEFTLK